MDFPCRRNLGLRHVGHSLASLFMPLNNTQPLAQQCIISYPRPSFFNILEVAASELGNEFGWGNMTCDNTCRSSFTNALGTPCTLLQFMIIIVADSNDTNEPANRGTFEASSTGDSSGSVHSSLDPPSPSCSSSSSSPHVIYLSSHLKWSAGKEVPLLHQRYPRLPPHTQI